jgi:predicted amidohydrolase
MTIKIALAQIAVTGDKRANRDTIGVRVREAASAGARLVVLPEASMYHFGDPRHPLGPASEAVGGPFTQALQGLAVESSCWILAGMFESVDGNRERVYNTLVLVDDAGAVRGTYRKIHLYDAFGYHESDRIAPGEGGTLLFEIDGLRFGALTCYDLRFPEPARHLARFGADAIVFPAAWLAGPLKEMQFETLLRARAIENTVYVGSADQCTPGFCGNSALYDPMGILVAGAGEAEGLVIGDVSRERLTHTRAINPSLHNGRSDVYATWSESEVPSET